MVPAAVLAIIAVGMAVAYVLPQRLQSRADYAQVRVDDRFSTNLRVVKTTARRVERAHRPSTRQASQPLLVTGAARSRITQVSATTMSRPAGPLDRAATLAERDRLAVARQQYRLRSRRAVQARRRAVVATLALLVSVAAWWASVAAAVPVMVAGISTAVFAAVVVAGARTAQLQREADSTLNPVTRQVGVAATATQALRRVAREQAVGHRAEPTAAETQAIRMLTSEDLHPRANPAELPGTGLPGSDGDTWTPAQVPAPAYTMKASARRRTVRPLNERDFAQADAAARAALEARDHPDSEGEPAVANLDAILSRRRRASA